MDDITPELRDCLEQVGKTSVLLDKGSSANRAKLKLYQTLVEAGYALMNETEDDFTEFSITSAGKRLLTDLDGRDAR